MLTPQATAPAEDTSHGGGYDEASLAFMVPQGASPSQPIQPAANVPIPAPQPRAAAPQPQEPQDLDGGGDSFFDFGDLPERRDSRRDAPQQVTPDPITNPNQQSESPVDVLEEEPGDYFEFTAELKSILPPVEALESEFPYDFGEGAKYRDFANLVKGVQEKQAYIKRVESERDQFRTEAEAAQEQVAATSAERDAVIQLYRGTMEEGDHYRMIARTRLPDEFRDVDPRSFEVKWDDYNTNRDEYLEKYVREHGPDLSDYTGTDDPEYKAERRSVRVKAVEAYDAHDRRQRKKYQQDWQDASRKQHAYENALSEEVRKIRQEAADRASEAQRRQKEFLDRMRASKSQLTSLINPKKLALRNTEDRLKVRDILETELTVYDPAKNSTEAKLQDVLLPISATYGTFLIELIAEGIRHRVSGRPSADPVDKPSTEPIRRLVRKSRRPAPVLSGGRPTEVDNEADFNEAFG